MKSVNGGSAGQTGRVSGPVVILVDNKVRDLNVAALVAHQLEIEGIPCRLEPLEAFRAALGAHRPSMIVFNHLNGGQLVRWSRRLADIGVLTAVLPNEGIVYNKVARDALAGNFHREAHVDNVFCWNKSHKDALLAKGIYGGAQIDIVGIPRFDIYFQPWSKLLAPAPARCSSRPRVLLCTNFVFARYDEAQAKEAFGGWEKYNPAAKDYWSAVLSHRANRVRMLDYANTLIDDGRFELVLRPHPNEDHEIYETWLAGLSDAQRESVVYAPKDNISSLILDCDLHVACETCTTSIEAWIAKKPTLALIFDKNRFHYNEVHNAPNIPCGYPKAFADMVAENLSGPVPADKKALRDEHLDIWCASPDGGSVSRIVTAISKAVRNRKAPDWTKLDAGDMRRAIKLRAYQQIGQAYHFDPLLWLKASLFPQRYAMKTRGYNKSIMPADVSNARQHIRESLGGASGTQTQ